MPAVFGKLTGPRYLEEHAANKIRPSTTERYRQAAVDFTAWALPRSYFPSSAGEWDDLLVEYLHEQGADYTRAKFETLVSAVEFFFPTYKKKLAWSHQVISGWTATASIRHTVPLGKQAAKLIAMYFSSYGHARLGLGVIIQASVGLRPSELLGLVTGDVLLPEHQGRTLSEIPASLALGARTGTKVKRAQFVLLGKQHGKLVAFLRALVRRTPDGARLFPASQSLYRTLLAQAQRDLGVELGWTPHSPRAGFATDARSEGLPFTEIQEIGRWSSASSLRTYLDVVGSANIGTTLRAAGLADALRFASTNWPTYFPPSVLEYPKSG